MNELESAVAATLGVAQAVAVSRGAVALQLMLAALDLRPGDEVILPTLTQAATAHGVVFAGGVPVFVDVQPETLLIDPSAVESALSPNTRAIVAVDLAGQPGDYDDFQELADEHGLSLLADGGQALGAMHRGRPAGQLARMTGFGFLPVKPATAGEAGLIVTDDHALAARLRQLRDRETALPGAEGDCRLSELQCELGLLQLTSQEIWISRRREIARQYDLAFRRSPVVQPLTVRPGVQSSRQQYLLRLRCGDRQEFARQLQDRGIAVGGLSIPVHLHPYYRLRFGTRPGQCPVAEQAYEQILSLPLLPRMSDDQVQVVIQAVQEIIRQVDRLAA